MMLQLRCKACDETFDSGISFGVGGRPVLGEHRHLCPYCLTEEIYRNEDYAVKARIASRNAFWDDSATGTTPLQA